MRALLALTFFALAACKQDLPDIDYSQPGTVANGDMLVSASIGEASNLIPWIAGDSASHAIAGSIYEGLLEYDENLNLRGAIAESWQVSPDNREITFHLRRGLKWQDGTPLTSQDVLATYRTIIDPQTLTPYAGDYQLVKEATAPDAHTFKVTYDQPFSPALASWATLYILPAHKLDDTKLIKDNPLVTQPVGSGPYLLQKWSRGSDVVLKANPDYRKGEPHITYQRTRLITDLDAQFMELRAGRIDTMGLTPVQYTRLTEKPKFTSRFEKYRYLSNGYTYLAFNLKNRLFTDKKVRQALSFAAPRESIIRGVLLDQGEPITGPFKPGTWAYNDKLKPYPYDLAKAKAMLAEAGWRDTNGDGILDKNGKPFHFTVVTNQGNDQRIKTAEILQYAFKQVGVDMQIQVQEWSTLIENTINPRAFEAIVLGWSMSVEPDPFDIWHSSKTKPREFNFIGFNNPEADRLMVAARRTFDQAERKKYLDQFQEIVHDEQPYLFLYAPYSLVAVHKRVKGIVPMPAGIGYNSTDWYVPKNQQLYPAPALQP